VNTTARTLTAAVALLAAAGALAACTAVGPVQTPGITDPDAPATPVESQAPEFDPADLDQDGVVTGWERDQFARQSYTLPDGASVPLPAAGEPLPQEIVDAVVQNVAAEAGSSADADTVTEKDAFIVAMQDALAVEEAKLGRSILAIVHTKDLSRGVWVWAVGGTGGSIAPSATQDEAMAKANDYATRMGGADRFAIIVLA
jgi:hypothetical protein